MLEMVRALDTLEPDKITEGVKYVKETWKFEKPCDEAIIEKGVKYALAIGKKITARGWEAITLLDVDGMKKLEGFPPLPWSSSCSSITTTCSPRRKTTSWAA